jgi:hypothetical protein
MKAAARRKAVGTPARSKTPTEREALKKSVAELSVVRPGSGRLIADLLDPHFIAEDRLIAAERALAVADAAERKIRALQTHAAEESQTGTAADQAKWSMAFDRFRWEARDAKVALDRARFERDEASTAYYAASGELRNAVAYL